VTSSELLVATFVRWHYQLEAGDFTPHLSEDFTFDYGLGDSSREDYLALKPYVTAIERFAILELFATETRAAIMFEGVEEVTGLFHRYCWILALEGERIAHVSACVAELPSPEERPSLPACDDAEREHEARTGGGRRKP
jgi:hypothetical protein